LPLLEDKHGQKHGPPPVPSGNGDGQMIEHGQEPLEEEVELPDEEPPDEPEEFEEELPDEDPPDKPEELEEEIPDEELETFAHL